MFRREDAPPGVPAGDAQAVGAHLHFAAEHGMSTHERLRMGQDHLGAFVVERDADDLRAGRAAEQPPQSADGTRETLAVAPRNRDPRQAESEPAVLTLARLAEGGALPV